MASSRRRAAASTCRHAAGCVCGEGRYPGRVLAYGPLDNGMTPTATGGSMHERALQDGICAVSHQGCWLPYGLLVAATTKTHAFGARFKRMQRRLCPSEKPNTEGPVVSTTPPLPPSRCCLQAERMHPSSNVAQVQAPVARPPTHRIPSPPIYPHAPRGRRPRPRRRPWRCHPPRPAWRRQRAGQVQTHTCLSIQHNRVMLVRTSRMAPHPDKRNRADRQRERGPSRRPPAHPFAPRTYPPGARRPWPRAAAATGRRCRRRRRAHACCLAHSASAVQVRIQLRHDTCSSSLAHSRRHASYWAQARAHVVWEA